MSNRIYLLFFLLFNLSSCFKEESLSRPNLPNVENTAIIEMGPQYANQFFYNLSENRVISQNSRFAYDLLFENAADRFYIWLNTAKFMSVLKTTQTNLSQTSISDTTGGIWHYELGAFDTDSSAISRWGDFTQLSPVSDRSVYILNLGKDETDAPLGFVKFQLEDFDYNLNSYVIRYARIDDNTIQTARVEKEASRIYRYFRFSPGQEIVNSIEPPKTEWDFCFTRYTYVFYTPYYLPYLVTGVLANPERIEAYVDSTLNYANVGIGTIDFSRLSRKRDAIGYDWKYYETGDYFTKEYFTYFIRQNEDRLYKMRFITFKKDAVWGYPTFEYSLLQ